MTIMCHWLLLEKFKTPSAAAATLPGSLVYDYLSPCHKIVVKNYDCILPCQFSPTDHILVSESLPNVSFDSPMQEISLI